MDREIFTIFSAGKFDRKVTGAPASESDITAAALKKHGSRTFAAVCRQIEAIGHARATCISFMGVALLGGSLFGPLAVAAPQEKLVITGTGSSVAFMQLMGAAFQKTHAAVIVEVPPSIGSTGGIKAVAEGKIDIGLSTRALKPAERRLGVVEEPYGRTPFVFATHNATPSKGLTLGEIEEMYAGRRMAWPDGTPLRLVLRPVNDSYTNYLASINPGLKYAAEQGHSIPGVFVGITDQDAVVQLEKTPGSFGVTSACIIAAEKRKLKVLPVDGVAPTLVNLSSGRYPYSMTTSLVYLKDKYQGVAKDFIDFIFSPAGQKLIAQYGHTALPRTPGR